MSTVTSKNSVVKICFDGKRINSSLTDTFGDVDLFGCEESPTLSERINRGKK